MAAFTTESVVRSNLHTMGYAHCQTVGKNEAYAIWKLLNVLGTMPTWFGRKDDLLAWLCEERTVETCAMLASDGTLIKQAILVCAGIAPSTLMQRVDVSPEIVTKWEEDIVRTHLVSKLPKVRDMRRRYNRYHYRMFVKWISEKFEVTGDFRKQLDAKCWEMIEIADQRRWTERDANWRHFQYILLFAVECRSNQIKSEKDNIL